MPVLKTTSPSDLGAGGAAELALEARAVLEQDVAARARLTARSSRTSRWTVLNRSVPASPSSSNSAVSTLVSQAPARSALASPSSRFASRAGSDRVGDDVDLDARRRAARARSG